MVSVKVRSMLAESGHYQKLTLMSSCGMMRCTAQIS